MSLSAELEPHRLSTERGAARGSGVMTGDRTRHGVRSQALGDDLRLLLPAPPPPLRPGQRFAKPPVGAPLRDHRRVAPRCSISPPGTIPTGWSPAMATGHLLRSGPTTNQPWIRPHEQRSRLSHNCGAVQRPDGRVELKQTCRETRRGSSEGYSTGRSRDCTRTPASQPRRLTQP